MNELGTVYPTQQVVAVGGNVKLACHSMMPATWMKDSKILNVLLLFNTIQLTNITHEDGGVYTCKGYLDKEAMKPFEARTLLLVGYLQSERIETVSQVALVGEKKVLYCKSENNVRWYYVRSQDFPESVPISQDNSYYIDDVQPEHAGYYYCFGRMENSNKHFVGVTEVQVYDPSKISPNNIRLSEGENAEITCESSYPVTWHLFGNDSVLARGNVLNLKSVKLKNQNTYVCKSKTKEGFIIRAASQLDVLVNLPGRVSPSILTAYPGENVHFNCLSSVKVIWFHNGYGVLNNTVETTGHQHRMYTLKIYNVQARNKGMYTCTGKIGPVFFRSDATLLVKNTLHSPEEESTEVNNWHWKDISDQIKQKVDIRKYSKEDWYAIGENLKERLTIPENILTNPATMLNWKGMRDKLKENIIHNGPHHRINRTWRNFIPRWRRNRPNTPGQFIKDEQNKSTKLIFDKYHTESSDDVTMKIFRDPKKDCMKDGIWQSLDPRCMWENYSSSTAKPNSFTPLVPIIFLTYFTIILTIHI